MLFMTDKSELTGRKEFAMDILIPLGVLVGWVILQIWVLPRFGVKT
jgi:hypothetical protein